MSTHDLAVALDPGANVVVEACAGSGKTWLLVSRVVRLLLAGAQPSEILAITFTRKAAQEMESRLRDWLRVLALEDDATARKFLRERFVPEDRIAELLVPARHLLERHLSAEPPLTISTFHSWFLEILQRAPLNAGAVGKVALLEQTATLLEEAWGEFVESLRDPRQRALDAGFRRLLERYGLHSTKRLLFACLHARLAWWAWTQGRKDPVAFALDELRAQLGVDPAHDPRAALFADGEFLAAAGTLTRALAAGTEANRRWAAGIESALADADRTRAFAALVDIVLTDKGQPVANVVKAAAKKGAADAAGAFCAALLRVRAVLAEQTVYSLHEAALPCAQALIGAYQRLKHERGGMDFSDVEWRAWQLLTRSDHAEYMQYKLDARYRHILVDEFQDTSPAQWQILRAWLEAAAAVGRGPTIFLVGDPKQSIYRFRGAEARLFRLGKRFVEDALAGQSVTIPVSRRCAPTVIEAVNSVFAGEPLCEDFETHVAHTVDLPGRVEVLPLARDDEGTASVPAKAGTGGLRDPLTTPRPAVPEAAREAEARQLARRIGEIVGHWVVRAEGGDGKAVSRKARHGDIMVLVRRRSHLAVYERALRAARIPYLTSRQGGLLDTLEAADLMALLRFLITPFADLNLAAALRSPAFSCSDADLLELAAAGEGTWWQRLRRLADGGGASLALARARTLLGRWLTLVDRLPVHDLLDRIWFDADLARRYRDSVPPQMRETVGANLQAFVELALALDAGRYPSLPRFLDELAALRGTEAQEAPDEGVVGESGNAVRILTVHGAKGLEAPIVWLLDANAGSHAAEAYRTLVDWEPQDERPRHFSLITVKEEQGQARGAALTAETGLEDREELNVLYVAMTRAKQALIVSGSANAKPVPTSPYARIAAALGADREGAAFGADPAALSAGHAPAAVAAAAAPPVAGRLQRPLPTGSRDPSFATPETRRGEHVHRLLEHMAPPAAVEDRLWLRERLGVDDAEFEALHVDARAILAAPALARFFDPAQYVAARNELAYVDAAGEQRRIDRVVEFADEVWVLDYKTGDAAVAGALARYGRQLDEYAGAIAQVYPGKRVRAALVLKGGVLAAR